MESLEGLFSGLTWWSGQKLDKTHFLSENWTQKPQNCSKSISRELLVLRSWLTSQNNRKTWFAIGVLRYVHPSENRRCHKNTSFFFFFGSYKDEIIWFSIIAWTAGRIKLVDPLKMTTRMDLLWTFYDIYTPQTSGSAPKMFVFLGPYMMKCQTFKYHENYMSYWIGWPFKMTQSFIFLSVLNTIYTSRTKRNGLKREFEAQ